jgi:site-specific recombinase XerD
MCLLWWNTYCEYSHRSGLYHTGVHTLRYSSAALLPMNGVNIREIQELSVHKNVETTMIYTHE